MQDKTLFIVVNEDRFFLSHRKEIGDYAHRKGWDVTVVAKDTGVKKEIEEMGLHFINLPINPTGKNVFQELRVLRFLKKLYRRNPDAVVHHVGLKLLLWGSLANHLSPMRGVVNAVSGLGTLFTGDRPSRLIGVMFPLLRYCRKKGGNVCYIFQNHDDRQTFEDQKLIGPYNYFMIKGAGVDLDYFDFTPIPEEGKVKVVFTGRMIKEKGVVDLVKAANLLKDKYEDKVEFILCGSLSSNPSALTEEEVNKLADGKYIKWLNFQSDVRSILKDSTIFCLPSYREGFPKSIIEASAIGRPIVTYDSVGCRDTVVNGKNGFKVPLKDYRALAEKLDYLISRPEVCVKMGKASRRIAEKTYDVRKVVRRHLDIYDRLLQEKLKR